MFQICAKRKHISAPTKIVQYFLKTFIRSKKTDFPDHVDVVVIGNSIFLYSISIAPVNNFTFEMPIPNIMRS